MKRNATIKELKTFAKYSTPEQRQLANDVRTSHLSDDMETENLLLLQRCEAYYNGLSDFRTRRLRAFNYLRGRQWSDYVYDDDGNVVTEENYILSQGKIPFKNNVIRMLIRNIIGQMETQKTASIVDSRTPEDASLSEMLTNTLQYIQQLNEVNVLDPRNFEEFLMSGAIVDKTTYSFWPTKNREDVFTKSINPNFMFFNTNVKDIRGIDLDLVGEIIDIPLEKVIETFAQNEADVEVIKSWYPLPGRNNAWNVMPFDGSQEQNVNFLIPSDINLCRVIEVWEKVTDWRVYAHDYLTGDYTVTKLSMSDIKKINDQRIETGKKSGMSQENIPLIDARKKMESFWVVKYLTPYGKCLYQRETPYAHKSHPYTLTLFPLLNGEVWGLIEDIIDQQRNINRNMALLDFMMGSAAKGVLLVPEESIPEDMTIDDFADEWTKYNGVIKIKLKAGAQLPQQVSTAATNIGAMDMLKLQMDLVQQISGVNGAQMGQEAKSGTPNSLYVNQAANSSTNTRDLMNNFDWHRRKRNEKMLQVAIQFYKEKRYIASSGLQYSKEAEYYDPDRIQNFEFDLKISEGQDTPVFRQIISDQLFQMLQANMIDLQMFLENSGMPYAEKILAAVKSRQEQAAQAQQPGQPGQPGQVPQQGQPQPEQVPQPQDQQPTQQAQVASMSPQAKEMYDRLRQ